jgi:hypothetical protein
MSEGPREPVPPPQVSTSWRLLEAAAIGMLVGTFVGLSTSSVVSTALGAVLSIATALFLHATPSHADQATHGSDDRPKAVVVFALAALLACVIGLSARTHSALQPSIRYVVKQWTDAGYAPDIARLAALRERAGLLPKQWEAVQPIAGAGTVLYGAPLTQEINPLKPSRFRSVADTLDAWRRAGGDWKDVATAVSGGRDEASARDILQKYWNIKDEEKLLNSAPNTESPDATSAH